MRIGFMLVTMLAVLLAGASAMIAAEPAKKLHLFMLSGQSNMSNLDDEKFFTPLVTKAFPGDEIVVVKVAAGGVPISGWYLKWKPAGGEEQKGNGGMYRRLMEKVKTAVAGRTPDTVTFVWMQGERDAKEKRGEVYAASLRGVLDQLRDDLHRKDINIVIGRISDFDLENKQYPHWTMVREALVKVAESEPRAAWIDTDDLNGPKNDLHCPPEGYKIMGERFANKAIELIGKYSIPKP